jgi:hypothetical protein
MWNMGTQTIGNFHNNISYMLRTLPIKRTSYYVLYSGGCKCNSLWPVSFRSGRYDLRIYTVKQSKMRNFTFDAPWPEKTKEHRLGSVKQTKELKNEQKKQQDNCSYFLPFYFFFI